jgi:two-component system LytT family response regulator
MMSRPNSVLPIRTLIVDDEPIARERIRDLLATQPDIEVVGEAEDGAAAVAAIRRHAPELVFLDIQMPELDGFQVLAEEASEAMCVVFVTAYDQYALRAFEAYAAAYLLKPFDRDRFYAALERARLVVRGARGEDTRAQLAGVLAELAGGRNDRILVKEKGRVFFLRVDEIDWIESAGNYVRVHAGSENHLLRQTMTELERRLDAGRFVRIHRTALVNIERIRELQPLFHGEYTVVLTDGTRLTLSRRYRDRLQNRFGDFL